MLGAPGGLSGPGHRLARIALALGLPADATGPDIMETIVAARDKPGIPPKMVSAQDALLLADDIDLLAFPTR
ncbi:MAG: UbiD family decarboxylase [Actinomycetia bacterium]|nr:UbiD family decarboxylase [Actinomycetes bacterium]